MGRTANVFLAAALLAACGDRRSHGERGQVRGPAGGQAAEQLQAPAAGEQAWAGTVARASGDTLVLRQPGGTERTVRIGPATEIHRDGARASREALSEGVPVRVSLDAAPAGSTPTARAIEVEAPDSRRKVQGATGSASGAHGGQGSSPAGEGLTPVNGAR